MRYNFECKRAQRAYYEAANGGKALVNPYKRSFQLKLYCAFNAGKIDKWGD